MATKAELQALAQAIIDNMTDEEWGEAVRKVVLEDLEIPPSPARFSIIRMIDDERFVSRERPTDKA